MQKLAYARHGTAGRPIELVTVADGKVAVFPLTDVLAVELASQLMKGVSTNLRQQLASRAVLADAKGNSLSGEG